MRSPRRKATPKVVGGKVQRKNRVDLSPAYWRVPPGQVVVERLRPGPGHRHILRKSDVETFIGLLPDWDELSKGLRAVLLAPGEGNTDGWCDNGIVAVCAWERELWQKLKIAHVKAHADLLSRLDVRIVRRHDSLGAYDELQWTEPQIRAYQLLHILLHELGHHHDRMTTRSQRAAARGEGYAETYARKYEEVIWSRYLETFDLH
ncbi:MAG: hypothetical protein JXB13_15710 [Phycisphaerae bacterium]|nr:hypothetical protein [Phycisphaerae bacterium]